MYIESTLRAGCNDISLPPKKRTPPTPHMDDGNESDDPLGPLGADTSPDPFLGSIQQRYIGDIGALLKKPSETSTTPVSCSAYLFLD